MNDELQSCNELEYNIQRLLYTDNSTFCEFKKEQKDDKYYISLYTLKLPHYKKFKCITMEDTNENKCLNKIFIFLKKEIPNKKYINYHVRWTKREYKKEYKFSEFHSYFYVRNIQELLENFYSDIEVNDHDYCIQNIEMVAES
jgi:hypothetical protein